MDTQCEVCNYQNRALIGAKDSSILEIFESNRCDAHEAHIRCAYCKRYYDCGTMVLTFQFDVPVILCEPHSTAQHCSICKCWRVSNGDYQGLESDEICKCYGDSMWTWEMSRAERTRLRRKMHSKDTSLLKFAIHNRIRQAIEDEKKILMGKGFALNYKIYLYTNILYMYSIEIYVLYKATTRSKVIYNLGTFNISKIYV